MPKQPITKYKPGQAIHKEHAIYEQSLPKRQIIHLLNIKASSQDGYEQALNALQGKIVAMATTNEHLIVVTE